MRNTHRRLNQRGGAAPARRLLNTGLAAAAVLLLAAACSNGSDDAGRGTVPTATTAPAVTATSATDAAAPATTGPTANVTDVPDDSTTPVATVTETDTTPTGTTTPVTVGDTTPPVTGTTSGPTGTTETVTSTTGSGPTVPTTLPTTDDTTTPTTAATDDTDTDTEPRNKVDEQYPLNSAERRAYLEVSGGIAPAGATVNTDLGPSGSPSSQHGRTTADRWPNGFPAAPGSANYQTTTFAQRDAQRAARWVTLMNRSGVDHYWTVGVPRDPAEPFPTGVGFGPETPGMTLLRDYIAREYVDGAWGWVRDDQPPADAIWSYARWQVCGGWKNAQVTDHANTGINDAPCEMFADWVLFAFEQFVRDADSRPVEARARAMWHALRTAYVRTQPEVPAGVHPLKDFGATETVRLSETMGLLANDFDLVEWNVGGEAGADVSRHWEAEIAAGRKPWEQAAP